MVTHDGVQLANAANPGAKRAVESKKVWTSLITNTQYLSGLLLLEYSLKLVKSKYPLVALYTDSFPPEGHKALDIRGIPKQHVAYLTPTGEQNYDIEPRFYHCWSKLASFSLVEYDRVVQLDSDMLVLKNMDELMDIELDPPSLEGKGNKIFAASFACVCNPLKKSHYPKDWVPEACAFTSQHSDPDNAQIHGAPATMSLGMPNGGLQVVNPCISVWERILEQLNNGDAIASYDFADQSLLGDVFYNRWVTLPYIYNALKSLRWDYVHGPIWRDDQVKNFHYIFFPKPWEASEEESRQIDESHGWWFDRNKLRLAEETSNGIEDGY